MFYYSVVLRGESKPEGAIFERIQWMMKRKCCVAAVKNFKGKAEATAEIFGIPQKGNTIIKQKRVKEN